MSRAAGTAGAVEAGALTGPAACETPIELIVPFTTPALSRTALQAAAALTRGLRAVIVLVAVHVVSCLIPLDEPNVRKEHLEQRLRAMAEEVSLPVRIELVFAREQEEGLRAVLGPRSLVLIAARKRRWAAGLLKTQEARMAQFLARAGHDVMLLTI